MLPAGGIFPFPKNRDPFSGIFSSGRPLRERLGEKVIFFIKIPAFFI